jgi:uncharacterized lipoprotein YddW (UPF0748 family)
MAQGKVTASSLNLRNLPDTSADTLKALSTGTLVDIVKTVTGGNYSFSGGSRNDWHQVKVDDQEGFVAAAFVVPASPPSPTSASIKELRGVWIGSHFNSPALTSPTTITNALDFLQLNGFNTVFPAVWNQGFTAFPSQVMERNGFTKQDPAYGTFDPLREIVNQGKSRGMAVIPWFEYGFAASPDPNGGHILQTKPQWTALNISGQKVQHGGLTWMNSLDPEVQRFMLDLVLEVIETYDVVGIQGDDRFPAMPFNGGYDLTTKAQFKAKFGTNPPSSGKEAQWVQFRADLLTQYLSKLFKEVKNTKSNCIVSISPAPFPFGRDNLMQDSDDWVKKNIVDFLHPQFYRSSFANYKNEVDRIKTNFTATQRVKYAPGIAFTANGVNLTSTDIIQSVQYNRQNGLGGQVFFLYEGLIKNTNAMAIALSTQGGYNQIASLPLPFVIT